MEYKKIANNLKGKFLQEITVDKNSKSMNQFTTKNMARAN